MKLNLRTAVAGALAATMLSGSLVIAAPAALARPDSDSGATSSQPTTLPKAQLERLEQSGATAPKAQLEYQERSGQPSSPTSTTPVSTSEGVPWTVVGLSALAVAGLAGLGIAVRRHDEDSGTGRHLPASA